MSIAQERDKRDRVHSTAWKVWKFYCFLRDFGGVPAWDDPPARVSESVSDREGEARVAEEEVSRLKCYVSKSQRAQKRNKLTPLHRCERLQRACRR